MLRTVFAITLLAFFLMVGQAFADEKISTGFLNNIAIQGYDTVSYFQDNGPVKGTSKYKAEWNGANWYFASQDNLDTFKTAPEHYAPQYGGHCAWGAANAVLVRGDPKEWHIEDGKLYLHYDKTIGESWYSNHDTLISQAEQKISSLSQ